MAKEMNQYQPANLDIGHAAQFFHLDPDAFMDHFRNYLVTFPEGGRLVFMKLAGTEASSRYKANEAAVYQRNLPLPPGVVFPSFVGEGDYIDAQGQKFHFVETAFVAGHDIYAITINPQNPETIDATEFLQHVDIIAQTAVDIMQWTGDPLPLDVEREGTVGEAIERRINGWISKRLSATSPEKEDNLPSDIEQKAAKAYALRDKFFANQQVIAERLRIAACSGDFVPNSFRIGDDGTIRFVDVEHARMQWMKFYDVAYMYHRLYTKYHRPDLAQEYLKRVLPKFTNGSMVLSDEDREAFRFALADRLIGGYFDAVRDDITSWELQDDLADKVLNAENSLDELLH